MSEHKHTPGSWNPVQESQFWVVTDSQGQRLASLLESEIVFTDGIEHDDAQANAKLMAAAPELLEALQMAMEIGDQCSRAFLAKFQGMAKVAIAKATQ